MNSFSSLMVGNWLFYLGKPHTEWHMAHNQTRPVDNKLGETTLLEFTIIEKSVFVCIVTIEVQS